MFIIRESCTTEVHTGARETEDPTTRALHELKKISNIANVLCIVITQWQHQLLREEHLVVGITRKAARRFLPKIAERPLCKGYSVSWTPLDASFKS